MAAAALLLTAPQAFASRTVSARPELLASPALEQPAVAPALAPAYAPRGFTLRIQPDPHPRQLALFPDLAPPPATSAGEKLTSGVASWEPRPNLQRIQVVVAETWWVREHLGPVDSPNLYQAFGLDPMNITDPLGLAEKLSKQLHVPSGPIYRQYCTAKTEAQDPNNSPLARAGFLALQTASLPLAFVEEYVGRGLANTPHRFVSDVEEGSELLAQAGQEGDPAKASVGVSQYCAAFLEAGALFTPFSSEFHGSPGVKPNADAVPDAAPPQAKVAKLTPYEKGQQGVTWSREAAIARGETIVGQEVDLTFTINGKQVTVRADVLTQPEGANYYVYVESKYSPQAGYTPNQETVIPELVQSGDAGLMAKVGSRTGGTLSQGDSIRVVFQGDVWNRAPVAVGQ